MGKNCFPWQQELALGCSNKIPASSGHKLKTKNELGKNVVYKMNVGPKFAQALQYSPVTKGLTLASYFY
jgi:hypothetical protein